MNNRKRGNRLREITGKETVPVMSPPPVEEDRPAWLPEGWKMELKRRSGFARSNRIDRYYTCPLSGKIFRSRPEVMHYLKVKLLDSPASVSTLCDGSDKKIVCAAQIDYSPSELPCGWIKETRTRKDGIRTDTYYIDTVSGYGFRSKKDVYRYIENKEVCRHAFRWKNMHAPGAYSSKKESLPLITPKRTKEKRVAVRRRLFSGQKPILNARTVPEIAGLPQRPALSPLGHVAAQCTVSSPMGYASAQCDDGSETSCLTPANVEHLEQGNGKFQIENQSNPMAFHGDESSGQPTTKMLQEPDKFSKSLMQLEGERLPVPDANPIEEKQFELTKKQNQPTRHGGELPCVSNSTKATRSVCNQPGLRKRKALRGITVPVRASKRLAGVTADPVSDFGVGDRSTRANTSQADESQPTVAKDSDASGSSKDSDASGSSYKKDMPIIGEELQEKLESEKPLVDQAAHGQQVDMLTTLPFGDSWPDPCIEFAFKTLTSDFPVLEEISSIQDYFSHQLISPQNPSLSASPTSLASDGPSPVFRDDCRPCSVENGKVNKDCHQKSGLNH